MTLVPALINFVAGDLAVADDVDANFTAIRNVVNNDCLHTNIPRTLSAALTFGAGTMLFAATCDVGSAAAPARDAYLTGALKVSNIQVVGSQKAAVADATDAASAITQLNALLNRLRAATGHGLIA